MDKISNYMITLFIQRIHVIDVAGTNTRDNISQENMMTEISTLGKLSRILFDRRDYALVNMVNKMISQDKDMLHSQRRYFHYFHPRGIKELAESKGLRIAYAVIHLLESLESGQMEQRLNALRALRDEVTACTNQDFRNNTGRVLVEIMKDLVRSKGEYKRQVALAHDFRRAVTGKPRIVRALLDRYHLLEMPEEWNQLAFDDHVHDANTKGRKSATHLVMDAWIKGIRRLRVVYYNFIRPETAAELLEAASIMGITVRIGIEFSALFHNKFAQLIWVPRGFASPGEFLKFLEQKPVQRLMEQGQEVSKYQEDYVYAILENFNKKHLHSLNTDLGIRLEPLCLNDFKKFVGQGQASILHLAKYIHTKILPLIEEKISEFRSKSSLQDRDTAVRINRMEEIDTDIIHDLYLVPEENPEIENISHPKEPDTLPALMRLSPAELTRKLAGLSSAYRITLNLTNMELHDVIEILFECEGRITRLEIFNLKDHSSGKTDHIPGIARLLEIINNDNPILLKRLIIQVIDRLKRENSKKHRERIEKLYWILANIESFGSMYAAKRIKPRVGSDSTGQSPRLPGMGLVVIDSLPKRAQKAAAERSDTPRMRLPFIVETHFRVSYIHPPLEHYRENFFTRFIRRLPGLKFFGYTRKTEWFAKEDSATMAAEGNIVTLGGLQRVPLGLVPVKSKVDSEGIPFQIKYLNSHTKNLLKVTAGFLPAFLTFYFTHDWPVLAWFGAFIWFAITGSRNIIQSVLGGGGLRRSPLLQWNDLVSWDRVTDSLFFTGFSVPLLDYLTKTIILDRGLSITTATQPALLYAIMALVNGCYLTSHNIFRGLPKEAAFANFFRSIISIPVAYGFNAATGGILSFAGVSGVAIILQNWAAVISKTASDTVAGVIEGLVDRARNVENRIIDYRQKIKQLMDTYAKLEMLHPNDDVSELLEDPSTWFAEAGEEAKEAITVLIINALDLLYFWMYQPRAQTAFRRILCEMSPEEREIFVRAQSVLTMEKEISLMFIGGILGENFSKPLAFYLDRGRSYIREIERETERIVYDNENEACSIQEFPVF